MFTACCLFFISPSFSFWTYPRMSCDELIKIHRIFFVCMRFSRYVDDNKSKWKPHASHYFRLSAQETSFLSLTDILRISLPSRKSRLMHVNMQHPPLLSGSSYKLHYQMEMERFELLTPCLQGRCSPNWATPPLGNNCIYFVNWLYILAATCSPTPSPVQYHRPLGS